MPRLNPNRQLKNGSRLVVELLSWLETAIVATPLLVVLLILLLFGVLLPLVLYHSLAILASCALVLLFVYVHNVVEHRYFSKTFLARAKGSRAGHWVILSNRLMMLCIFIFFENLLLANWGLYDPKSPGLFVHFWLIHLFVLIWAFNPPSEMSEALSSVNSRAATTITMAVIVGLAVFIGDLGARSADNRLLQNVAFGVVMAVFLAAVLSFYDRGMKYLVRRYK